MPFGSPDRILRIRTVIDRTGLSRSTLYRRIDQGSFPKQVRISERNRLSRHGCAGQTPTRCQLTWVTCWALAPTTIEGPHLLQASQGPS
jgi:hypothetical protein